MAAANLYWVLAENISKKFETFASQAKDVHGSLESNDDPGMLASGIHSLVTEVRDFINTVEDAVEPLNEIDLQLLKLPVVKL